jgi:hypothetical protein
VSDAAGLIQAIRSANSTGGANTINLVPNTTITLTIAENGDTATGDRNGLPVVIGNDLTINGNNSTIIRNSGAEPFRFVSIDSSATLRLNDLTLSGGSIIGAPGASGTASADGGTGGLARGGAIMNRGTLVTTNLKITNAQAAGGAGGIAAAGTGRAGGKGGDGSGGGIGNSGTLIMTGGIFTDVTATGGAGGNGGSSGTGGGNGGNGGDAFGAAIFNDGTLTITQTTFASGSFGPTTTSGAGGNGGYGNVNVDDNAPGGGGGHGGTAMGGAITLWSGAATISQASFSGNQVVAAAGGRGGDGNSAGFGGGGGAASGGAIALYAGTITITNSTFSGNSASGGRGGSSGFGTYTRRICDLFNALICNNIVYAGNTEQGGGGGEGAGGAIAIHIGVATVLDSSFGGNTTRGGDGGFVQTSGGAWDQVSSLTGQVGAVGGLGRGGAVSNDGTLQLVGNSVSASTASGGSGSSGGSGPNIAADNGFDFSQLNGGGGGSGGEARGGAIDNEGSLTLSRNSLTTSRAAGGIGGGGGSAGNCGPCTTGGHGGTGALGGNAAGGAMYNTSGTVANTTISDAQANGGNGGGGGYPAYLCCDTSYHGTSGDGGAGGKADGGGIMDEIGSLGLINSTIAGGIAAGGTGGISPRVGDQFGRSGDYGKSSGGGIINAGAGAVTLTNTIMLNSVAGSGANCSGAISGGGHNLEWNPVNTCPFSAGNHDLFVDPKLPATISSCFFMFPGCSSNVSYFPLPYSSPARAAGDPAVCAGTAVGAVDARNKPRPATHCDIGAFELQPASFSATLVSGFPTITNDVDAGAAAQLAVVPSTDTPGDYSSVAHFICDDPVALCPADYTFGASESSHTFSFTPNTTGVQTVILTDPTSLTSPRTTLTFTVHPSLIMLDVTSGTTAGGNTVTVTGAGFITAQSSITINGNAVDLSSVSVLSGTSLTVHMPAHDAGSVTIGLVVRNILSRTQTTYTYSLATPTLTSLSSTSGSVAGGNTVTITGTNFVLTGTTVTFDASPVATNNVTIVDDHTIRVVMPAHASGVVQIGVYVGSFILFPIGIISSPTTLPYTYVSPPPTLTSLSSTSGSIAGGNTITITGSFYQAFFPPTTVVTIDGTIVNPVGFPTDTSLQITMPAHAAGTVQIGVTNYGVASATTLPYTYVNTQLTLTGVAGVSGQTAIVGHAFATNLAVTVTDSASNPVSNVAVTFIAPISGASGTFTGGVSTAIATTDASGVATAPTFTANSTTGAYTVSASATGVIVPVSLNLTNTFGVVTTFAITGLPATAQAGTAMSITVTAKDAANNTVTGYIGTVHFTGTDTHAILPANYTFIAGDGGAHTFTNGVTLKTAGTQSITVTDTGNGSVTASRSLPVSPATAHAIAVINFPSPIAVNTAAGFTLVMQDSFGNTASGYTGTVRFTSTDNRATLPANYTFTGADQGVHTFSATLKTPGTQGITATDTVTSATTGSQTSITVTAGSANTVTVSAGNNQSAVVGHAFATNLAVTVTDASSNPVVGVSVTFAAPSTGARGSFSGNSATATATTSASGVATMPTFTAGTVTGAFNVSVILPSGSIFNPFTLTNTPDGADHLVLTGASSAIAGTAVSVTVTAQDQFGNTATGYIGAVHFTDTDPQVTAGSGLPANYSFVVGDNGVHTFTGGLTPKTAGNRSVTAMDTNTASIAGSLSIQVTAAVANALSASGGSTPQTAQIGTSIATPLTALVTDAFGNPVSGVSVTFTAPVGGASGSFAGGGNPSASTNANGLATAPAFTANTTAGSYTVSASAAGVGAPTTFSLTNSAGAPGSISVSAGGTQNATVSSAFGTALAALVKDAANNPVPNVTVTFVVPTSGPGGTFSVTGTSATATTNASGVATAPGFTANTTAGAYAVSASASGVATPATFNLTNDPGSAASLVVTDLPNPTAAGATANFTLTAKDQFGNTATGYRGTVQFAISDSAGTKPGSYTYGPGDGGTRAFIATLKTVGSQTITVTDSVAPSLTVQQAVLVVPGTATAVIIANYPSPAGIDTTAGFTVIVRDAFGNTASGYRGTLHFTSSDAQAVVPGNYTFTGADQGAHLFSATLKTLGTQSISATDTAASGLTGSQANISVVPTVTQITPNSGEPAGGMTVTLKGNGFAAGATVTFDNVPGTAVTIVDSTTITVKVPAHLAGVVDVKVAVGGATVTLSGAFTYGTASPVPAPKPPGIAAPGGPAPDPVPGQRPPGPTGSGPAPGPLPPTR